MIAKLQQSRDKAKIAQNAKRTAVAANKQLALETEDDRLSAGFTRAFAERVC